MEKLWEIIDRIQGTQSDRKFAATFGVSHSFWSRMRRTRGVLPIEALVKLARVYTQVRLTTLALLFPDYIPPKAFMFVGWVEEV